MCSLKNWSVAIVVLAVAVLASIGQSDAPKPNDAKDTDRMSLAGRWKVTDFATPDAVDYWIFTEDGTFQELTYYKDDPNTPGDVNSGVWQEEGGMLSATVLRWEEPANKYHKTAGGDLKDEVPIRLEKDGNLHLDRHTATRQTTTVPTRIARVSRVATELLATGDYKPTKRAGDTLQTHCSEYARDLVHKLYPGEGKFPELEGNAATQLDNLAKAGADSDRTGVARLECCKEDSLKDSLKQAQDKANEAKGPVLVGWKNPNPKKDSHICSVVPLRSDDTDKERTSGKWGDMVVPRCAQAGETNFAYGKLSDAFGPDKKNDLQIYYYQDPKKPQP